MAVKVALFRVEMRPRMTLLLKLLFSGAVANSWSRCELVITMARGLILCLLHALAVASALVITPAVRAVRLAPRAACPTMDGDGPMVGKCKWFK